MKIISVIITLFALACSDNTPQNDVNKEEAKFIKYDKFQIILEETKTQGSILFYNLNENSYYSNDFEWAKTERPPASTFKIPNSIIGIETGVVDADTTIFRWNGEELAFDMWEKDMNLKEAFHNSCVPCYQEIARKIGVDRMNKFLSDFNYGNMKIDSSNLDKFWLEGDFAITQIYQIEFLLKLYNNELPVSESTHKIMKEIMLTDELPNEILRAKTGWAIRNGKNNGWYVGYIAQDTNAYFFAVNIIPDKDFDMSMFQKIRKDITFRALKEMGIIE